MRVFMIMMLLTGILLADHDKYEQEHEKHEEYRYTKSHMPLDLRYLGLSKKQLKEAREIIRKFMREYKAYYRQKEDLEKSLSNLFVQKEFDTDTYRRLMLKQRKETVRIETDFFAQMHRILTPKQRKRFIKYMEEWEIE